MICEVWGKGSEGLRVSGVELGTCHSPEGIGICSAFSEIETLWIADWFPESDVCPENLL